MTLLLATVIMETILMMARLLKVIRLATFIAGLYPLNRAAACQPLSYMRILTIPRFHRRLVNGKA